MDTLQDRWHGIVRPYNWEDVKKIQGSYKIEYTIAKLGAEKLWKTLNEPDGARALGALTGNQAMQQVKAGLKAIYCSGWQVAADANEAGMMYPDQSLYPANSVPQLVRKINNALLRADQIESMEGKVSRDWLAPIVADAEAGFGGPLNAYELMKAMIEAGASGVHYEDQLSSEKRCGHMGSKVLIPTKQFIKNLIAARLATDVMEVPTILIARTDAESASFITSDADEYDTPFINKSARSSDGFYELSGSPMDRCIARGLAYAPYADLIWMETSYPDLSQAKKFAESIHTKYPGKMLAYNCSPSFNWKAKLSQEEMRVFQNELAAMGYKFQFITLAGFHSLNYGMFDLALKYKKDGMAAYSELQENEFASQSLGYTAVKHQREVGTGYFDTIRQIVDGGDSGMSALGNSTEHKQF